MNLTILYQMNSVGEKLLNTMQKIFDEVEYRVLSINNVNYYQIDRIDHFSSVRRIINTPRAVSYTHLVASQLPATIILQAGNRSVKVCLLYTSRCV